MDEETCICEFSQRITAEFIPDYLEHLDFAISTKSKHSKFCSTILIICITVSSLSIVFSFCCLFLDFNLDNILLIIEFSLILAMALLMLKPPTNFKKFILKIKGIIFKTITKRILENKYKSNTYKDYSIVLFNEYILYKTDKDYRIYFKDIESICKTKELLLIRVNQQIFVIKIQDNKDSFKRFLEYIESVIPKDLFVDKLS